MTTYVDLHHIIKSPQPLSNDHCKFFLFQLLRDLKCLHSTNGPHHNLKPGNILVNANFELKICDFKQATTTQAVEQYFKSRYDGTYWYRAPEILLSCDKYGTSVDVWSVGCIFAELLGRKPLFAAIGWEYAQLKLIISILGTQMDKNLGFMDKVSPWIFIKSLSETRGKDLSSLYPSADPLALDLLKRMLVFDPRKRISVRRALRHPYLAGFFDPSKNPPTSMPINLYLDENMSEGCYKEVDVALSS